MKTSYSTRRFKKFVCSLAARAAFFIATALVLGTLTLSGVAFAQLTNGSTAVTATGDEAFTNVTSTVCGVADGLTGPLGIGIGFLVLVAGLVALQVASRDAIPMIARAAVGTALLLGSSLAFAAILGTTACSG